MTGSRRCGGFADPARTRPWQPDMIVHAYSVIKIMTALTALLLADRGEVDLAAPVSRYWPQFATNGKQGVTLAHLLSHSSGLSGWAQPIEAADLYDWEKVTDLLAAQAPFWPPGTAGGYHVLTQGYLVGEVVRRIAGRTLGTMFRQEIAQPPVVGTWRLSHAYAVASDPRGRVRPIPVTSGVGNVLHRPGQNAELVSLRVCENSPRGVSRLTDVDRPGAHRHEPLDFFLRCAAICA